MSPTKYALLATVAVVLMSTAPAARAGLIWNWAFNGGAEAGTFETDGTAADLATSSNFVIKISTFTVTTSTFAPGAVGLTYNAGVQPDVGFLWNGSAATQFYRESGVWTNGSNIYGLDSDLRYIFYADNASALAKLENSAGDTDFVLLSLSGQETTVPAPATFGLLVPSLLGLAAVSRRRRVRCTPRVHVRRERERRPWDFEAGRVDVAAPRGRRCATRRLWKSRRIPAPRRG